jgi:aminocarboxymuconate-semialdehyde decarboxylase
MSKIQLDVHAHLIPIEYVSDAPGVAWDAAAQALSVDGKIIGLKQLFQPAALLAWMDKNDVAQAWISVPPPAYRQQLNERASEDWSNRLNEGAAATSAQYPDRLKPLYHLPVEHPGLAAKLAHALDAERFALCAGGETDLTFSDARLDPLWSIMDARKAFVFLHPGRCCDGRLSPFYLENLVGNPHETAVTVAHLVFGGVLTRFPNIRFCLSHGGGTVPMIAGRWQRGFDTEQPGVDTRTAPPAVVLSGLYVDCLTHSRAALACSAEVFGQGRLLFGSDWPFLMGLSQPHDYLAQLPQALRDQIYNAGPELLGTPGLLSPQVGNDN